MSTSSVVGETALVAVGLLLRYFTEIGLVLSSTLHAANNSTISYQVLAVTFKTAEGSNGVDSRRVGRYSHLILDNTVTERIEVERESNHIG